MTEREKEWALIKMFITLIQWTVKGKNEAVGVFNANTHGIQSLDSSTRKWLADDHLPLGMRIRISYGVN